MDQNEINDRVARGAALLDSESPEWLDIINLDELSMSSDERCIIGQTYRDYDTGCAALFDAECPCAAHTPEVLTHGFEVSVVGGSYRQLGDAWRALILARRNPQVHSLLAYGWQLSRDSLSMISPGTGRELAITSIGA